MNERDLENEELRYVECGDDDDGDKFCSHEWAHLESFRPLDKAVVIDRFYCGNCIDPLNIKMVSGQRKEDFSSDANFKDEPVYPTDPRFEPYVEF